MSDAGDISARQAAEAAVRASYGRLVATLSVWSRDIAAAEDALGEALTQALVTWPERGVPDRPEAWLLHVARNEIRNRFRHLKVQGRSVDTLLDQIDERVSEPETDWGRDERLRLLFACTHPAIDAGVRTPLMLQAVLGLDAGRIANAFLVAPSTMGQRLVRAKQKIKQVGIPFVIPEREELPERLDHVLRAVYAAFGSGHDDLGHQGAGLTREALFLGRLLAELMPDEPEIQGLLALMLFCEARREARRDEAGRFVPLHEQDSARWDRALIIEGERRLTAASRAARFGRFQCEAAIQSVHLQRGITGQVEYAAIETLYDLLMAHAPSVGAAVARAANLADSGQAERAEQALSNLEPGQVATYQPYWVTRARICEAMGQLDAQRSHLERALGLTEDPAMRAFLQAQIQRLWSAVD